MKHAVKVTQTKDGAWAVSQLKKDVNNFYKQSGGTTFVDFSKPRAAARLLKAIEQGLAGRIAATSDL